MSDADKKPALPWYPRDFAADEPVQLMSLAEEGAYRRLLDHQWLHGSIPGDLAQVAAICKNVPVREMRKMWPKIEPCFEKMSGLLPRLVNRKMERVRADREAFLLKAREAGSLGGKKRWEIEREKQREYSDPTSDPITTATETLVAETYPAVAVASAVAGKASLPADAAPMDVTDGQIMAAIRTLLYTPDGKPPEGWEEGREFSIMRQLRKLGKSGSHIMAVVEGLAELRRDGRVDWLKGKVTLRAVFNSKSGCLDMWNQAEDAYHRIGNVMGKRAKGRPEDVRNDFARAAEQFRAKAG